MIKISLSGDSSFEQKTLMDKLIAVAVENYLTTHSTDSVKLNWRKSRKLVEEKDEQETVA